MNAREFAHVIGRPRGTVRRWLRQKDGLPHRKYGNVVDIDFEEGRLWVAKQRVKAGDRAKNRVSRTRT